MKACVVDDDYTSRQLLSDFLEDEGLTVVRFDHPNKVSEIQKSTLSDELKDPNTQILIMDVRFGRDTNDLKRGLTAVEELVKESHLGPKCVVLFVSQFGRDAVDLKPTEDLLNERQIKFFWIDKPIDYVELKQILLINQ